MHFHDLRHSAATILISMGIHPKVIQELLVHSDISITLGIYGHLFPSMQKDIVEKWQGVFGVATFVATRMRCYIFSFERCYMRNVSLEES